MTIWINLCLQMEQNVLFEIWMKMAFALTFLKLAPIFLHVIDLRKVDISALYLFLA